MTTTGMESASFQTFSMADDSMEISSEHGGLIANDDIDIDIDFTAGPNDEDYMLEDAGSDVEFRESFETAPLATNDDVMVEDYNSSLEQQHDDYDEQLQDIPDETLDAPEMEVSNNELPAPDHTDRRDSNSGTQASASDAHVQLDNNAVEITSLDANEEIDQTRSPQHAETLLPAVSPTPNLYYGLPDDTITHPHSPDNLITKDEAKSPGDKDTLAEESGTLVRGDHYAEHQTESVAAGDYDTRGELEVTEDILNQEYTNVGEMDATYGGIMVSYQDTQYALFSSFEDDDSDSFFLTDRSITQKPISSFLKALRDILQEELADDDELCIAIDVLRLEFGERSAEIDKVTFHELVSLYQQLLQNDGIDSPEPLHFTLGTRPEFAKRFVGLLTGASEGKGLSELVPRDEESESYDDVDAPVYFEEDYGLDHSHNQDDGQRDDTTQNDEDVAPSPRQRSEDDLEGESTYDISTKPEELDNPQAPGQLTEDAHEEEGDEKEGLNSENIANETSLAPASDAVVGSQEVQSEQKSEAAPKSVAEKQDEDDLIDYGDEVIDNTKRVAAPPKTDTASWEAINEELRRRSLSRAAENAAAAAAAADPIDEAATATSEVVVDEAQQPTNDTDEIDYDFDEEVKQADSAPQESHEDVEGSAEADGIQHDQDKVDDYYTGFDDQQDEEDGQAYNFEDEFDDGQDLEGEDQNLTSRSGDIKVVTSTVTEYASLESNDASPREEISTESVTVSADTVDIDEIDYEDDLPTTTVEKAPDANNYYQSHISPEADNVDEIDYEDDDEDEAVTPQSTKPEPLLHTSSSTPGKRQRSESMSEVALGEDSQEAKRIRS